MQRNPLPSATSTTTSQVAQVDKGITQIGVTTEILAEIHVWF